MKKASIRKTASGWVIHPLLETKQTGKYALGAQLTCRGYKDPLKAILKAGEQGYNVVEIERIDGSFWKVNE